MSVLNNFTECMISVIDLSKERVLVLGAIERIYRVHYFNDNWTNVGDQVAMA